jgi:hypothetical protein
MMSISLSPLDSISLETDRVKSLPPIYFYIPKRYWPANGFPKHPEEYWDWQNTSPGKYQWGMYNWTLQTYLFLRSSSLSCSLIDQLPEEGIVISHKDFLPDHLQPGPKLLLVCIQGDKTKHPYAQLHIVQNLQDEVRAAQPTLWDSYYIPHWAQSSLIPRNPARGDRFETIAFMGDPVNLAPELHDVSFQKTLAAMGMNLKIVGRDGWNDYSDIDAILAVRNFAYRNDYRVKPALKLCNAWHAGVPAILGKEPAYQAERKSPLDYWEVESLAEVLKAIQCLRDDVELRRAVIANGHIRARETSAVYLTARWCHFLANTAAAAYDRWCNGFTWNRQIFIKRRYMALKKERLQQRLHALKHK